MFVYEFNNKIYCANCYMKVVPKEEKKPIHAMDGTEFYHRFQNHRVKCAGCEFSIQHDHLHKASYKSIEGPGKEED